MINILHGQNDLAISDRVHQQVISLDHSNFSTSTVNLADVTLLELKPALHTTPFFGGQRVVVLRGPALSRKRAGSDESDDGFEPAEEQPSTNARGLDWSETVDALALTPETTQVICWITGALASSHVLMKKARERNWPVEVFRIPRGADLTDWVSSRAASVGARITPDAVPFLLDLLYPSVWRAEARWDTTAIDMRLIATEIDKLACASDDGDIDATMVESLVADRSGYTAFRLTDAIFAGDPGQALIELEKVLEAGEPAERVLGQLSGELILRSSARAAADIPAAQVAGALKMSEGRITSSRKKRGAHDQAALVDAAELVREADAAVKGGRSRDTATVIIPLTAELTARIGRRRSGR